MSKSIPSSAQTNLDVSSAKYLKTPPGGSAASSLSTTGGDSSNVSKENAYNHAPSTVQETYVKTPADDSNSVGSGDGEYANALLPGETT